MNVFVTGGTGFIGSAVVRHLLKADYEVRVLARDKANIFLLEGLDIDIVEGNITSLKDVESAMYGCPIVINLASMYAFLPFWEKKGDSIYATNVQGAVNVLTAARNNKVRRFIYTSSIAAIGKRGDGKKSDEQTAFNFESTGYYGRSKYLAEQEVLRFVKKDLPAVILNPGIVLGQRDHKPTPSGDIIVKFLNRQYLGYFDTLWAIADVDSIAQAHVAAIEKGRIGERYILCNEDHYSMKEIFQLLEKLSGVKFPRLKIPHGLLTAYVYADEWISSLFKKTPLIASEALMFCKNSTIFDNSRAVSELGYSQVPIEETLKKAVEWYKNNGYVK